jgi:nitrous oxide reductase accessory protein NosL
MRIFRTLTCAFLIAAFAVVAHAWMGEGPKCAECGMKVDMQSRYSARALTKDGKAVYFCDIGDMIHHLMVRKKIEVSEVYVRDFKTGEEIDARKAFYVSSGKFSTPMSWSIAAFRDESEAKMHGNKVKGFDEAVSVLDR